jgi:hypothetical protein
MLDGSSVLFRLLGGVLVTISLAGLTPGTAHADADPAQETLEEVLQILAERGIIDETQHARLVAKAQSGEGGSHDVAAQLLDGFEWSGDLRLRYETFWYDKDSSGEDRDNRYRFRYRARLGFKKKLTDRFKVAMRLASGTHDPTSDPDRARENRTTNVTLGDEEDFDYDPIYIDRVYAEFLLPETSGIASKLHGGKIPNPFIWKHGKDFLVWDKDVNPEGFAFMAQRPLSERTRLFFNVGYFIADENATSKDPKVTAAQLGGTTRLSDDIEVGLRFSAYEWRSLDDDFVTRAGARGNLPSAFDGGATIGDVGAFARFTSWDAWPLELYGTFVKNFEADSATIGGISVDEEDEALGLGFELGSSKKWVKLGVGYFRLEANSVIAQFTDSDLFDGLTNRRGWLLYASRRLAPGVELKLEFFDSDSIKNSTPFQTSVGNGDRKRFRTDIQFKY